MTDGDGDGTDRFFWGKKETPSASEEERGGSTAWDSPGQADRFCYSYHGRKLTLQVHRHYWHMFMRFYDICKKQNKKKKGYLYS